MTTNDPRAELIAGLRALADFYETHPDMPLPPYPEFRHCVRAEDDTTGSAEVERIAERLGVQATRKGGSANVEHQFDGVTFSAFYVSQQRSKDWAALVSYSGAVLPA